MGYRVSCLRSFPFFSAKCSPRQTILFPAKPAAQIARAIKSLAGSSQRLRSACRSPSTTPPTVIARAQRSARLTPSSYRLSGLNELATTFSSAHASPW